MNSEGANVLVIFHCCLAEVAPNQTQETTRFWPRHQASLRLCVYIYICVYYIYISLSLSLSIIGQFTPYELCESLDIPRFKIPKAILKGSAGTAAQESARKVLQHDRGNGFGVNQSVI